MRRNLINDVKNSIDEYCSNKSKYEKIKSMQDSHFYYPSRANAAFQKYTEALQFLDTVGAFEIDANVAMKILARYFLSQGYNITFTRSRKREMVDYSDIDYNQEMNSIINIGIKLSKNGTTTEYPLFSIDAEDYDGIKKFSEFLVGKPVNILDLLIDDNVARKNQLANYFSGYEDAVLSAYVFSYRNVLNERKNSMIGKMIGYKAALAESVDSLKQIEDIIKYIDGHKRTIQ